MRLETLSLDDNRPPRATLGELPALIGAASRAGLRSLSLRYCAFRGYMGTSLKRNRRAVGPCSGTMPRALGGSQGGGCCFMSEVFQKGAGGRGYGAGFEGFWPWGLGLGVWRRDSGWGGVGQRLETLSLVSRPYLSIRTAPPLATLTHLLSVCGVRCGVSCRNMELDDAAAQQIAACLCLDVGALQVCLTCMHYLPMVRSPLGPYRRPMPRVLWWS